MAVSCCKQTFYNFDKFFFLVMCYFHAVNFLLVGYM